MPKPTQLTVSGARYLLGMKINCESCVMKELACSDCVMSVLLEITTPSELDGGAMGAISALAESGLVPPLRFAQ